MPDMHWGLLGPERLVSARRTRTLGLGASVRSFNDLAVPGTGGVWFGKQLFLATLGVAVAKNAPKTGRPLKNIETANAIEALACLLALKNNNWRADARLLGINKLRGKTNLAFEAMRRRGYYVTQPMRMATVQALPALGLVESGGRLFNAFRCSQHGYDLIEAVCADYNPCYRRHSVLEYLADWVKGGASGIDSNSKVHLALSPLVPLSERAVDILQERLIQGGPDEPTADKVRRRAALAWAVALRNAPDQPIEWHRQPAYLDNAHWHDLQAGALFFRVRAAALALLDAVETHIGNSADQQLALNAHIQGNFRDELHTLRARARNFLNWQHRDDIAKTFCLECTHSNDVTLLKYLVARDDRVLRLVDNQVLPGPAFLGKTPPPSNTDESDTDESEDGAVEHPVRSIAWPEGISHRIKNLFLLNADMHGQLENWINPTSHNRKENGS